MAAKIAAGDVTIAKDVSVLESLDADLDVLIEDDHREERQYPDFTKGSGESWKHYAHRMCTEGHTFFDACLLAAGAIGQVMLTTPNAWYKMGLVPGAVLILFGTVIGVWTILQLKTMYDDRKRDLIKAGQWFDDPDKPYARKKKTQIQELMGHYLGDWGRRLVILFSFFSWFGTGVSQILASATSYYSIDQTYNLRTYCLIFGATLLPFGFIPNFRKARLILIFGVAGTLYTAAYGIYISVDKGFADAPKANLWPAVNPNQLSVVPFFNGAAVLYAILDHHSIVAETNEAMQHPKKFFKSYLTGFLPLAFMIVPPGILLNLAFAKSGIATAANWLQLAPPSRAKTAAVWMMYMHNIQAWTLWMTAFGFLWEKLIGTHEKPIYIRLGSRLPVLLAIWLWALAFPFYDSINSLQKGLTSPLLTYCIPLGAFLLSYRHKERRDACTYPLMRKIFATLGWRTFATINISVILYGLVLVACTCSMAIINLYNQSSKFGLFVPCYQCQNYVKSTPK